ncbi:hypothetical protein V6N13_090794 [Hibiscus sabdariffa]
MAGAAIIQLKALLGWNLESLISPKKRVWHLFSALISLKKGSGTCSQLCFLRPKGVVLANNTNGLLHPGVLASGKTCCTLFFTRVFVFKPQLKAVLVWVSAGAPLFSVILEHSTMAPVLIHRVLHHIFVAHESGTVFGPKKRTYRNGETALDRDENNTKESTQHHYEIKFVHLSNLTGSRNVNKTDDGRHTDSSQHYIWGVLE